MKLGGAISGEHGIGKEKKSYVAELEDPAKLALMRRIKTAFDPHGILNPGTIFDENARTNHERRPSAHPHAGRVRRRHLLHESRHVGDAFRGRPRRGARDAQRARALRRRRDRRRRRIRAHGRPAGGDVAAPRARVSATGSPTCTTRARARHPLVNIVGDHATYHKQYDAQLESDIETVARNVSQLHPVVGQDRARSAATRPTPLRPHSVRPARWRRSCCPPTSRGVTAARCASPFHAGAPRRLSAPVTSRAIAACAAVGRAGRAARRRDGVPRTAVGARPCDRRHHRREAPVRDVPDADRARRRAGSPSTASRTSPSSRRCSSTGCATSCSSMPRRPCRSSRIRTRRAGSRPTAARSTRSPDRPTTHPQHSRPSPTRSARPRRRPTGSRSRRRSCRPARSLRRPCARHSARCSPKARSSPTKATRRGCSRPDPPRAHRRHDWLCLTGGAIGQGLPVARRRRGGVPRTGASIALESDGSAMYTLQSLWTMARESLDVTTIIFNNGSYAVLNMELDRVGAPSGRTAGQGRCSTSAVPTSTSSRSAQGMGVSATRATTAEEFNDQLGARSRHPARRSSRRSSPRSSDVQHLIQPASI